MPAALGPSANVTLIGGRVTVSLGGLGRQPQRGQLGRLRPGRRGTASSRACARLARSRGRARRAVVLAPQLGRPPRRRTPTACGRSATPALMSDVPPSPQPTMTLRSSPARRSNRPVARPKRRAPRRTWSCRAARPACRGSRRRGSRARVRARTPTAPRGRAGTRRWRRRSPSRRPRRRSARAMSPCGRERVGDGGVTSRLRLSWLPAPDRSSACPGLSWLSSVLAAGPVRRATRQVGRPRRRPAHCRGATVRVRLPATIIRLDPPRTG